MPGAEAGTARRARAVVGPEQPSGKTAAGENFPVASLLIAPALRPHVMCFYDFARAIDDIADSPDLTPGEKLARLDRFERCLSDPKPAPPGYEKAALLRDSLAATGVGAAHATALVAAFRQDAVQSRYASWDDLMGYCALSAAPVGRYLLQLHDESARAVPAADALCAALQVLNHLQDCGEDYRALDRVYLPEDWVRDEGAMVADLGRASLSPPLRRVLDRCLAGCKGLLAEAAALPGAVRSPRLAAQAAVTLAVAQRLVRLLQRQDSLAGRVTLGKAAYALAVAQGLAWAAPGLLRVRRRRAP